MNMEKLRLYVALEDQKKEADKKLKAINKQLDELELVLIPDFITDGVQSMNVDGRTVYIARDIYAGPAEGMDKDSVVDVLKSIDETSPFITEGYNANTLKAWVRERAKLTEDRCTREQVIFDESAIIADLPVELRSALKVSIVPCLRSRK